jgi:hypothetical protein
MMRTRLMAPISSYITASCLLGFTMSLSAQSPPSTEQQLIVADRNIFAAMAGPHPDTDKLKIALGPEYSDVEDGEAASRDEVLSSYAHLTNFAFDYESPHAVLVSSTSGYVVADVHFSYPFNGVIIRKHKLTTTMFALREGKWVATLHTEMPFTNDREEVLAGPADSNPSLIAMRSLAADVMSKVHVSGYAPFPFYPVSLDAGTGVSFANSAGAHEADFSTLPPPMQNVWTQWASYTTDEPSGQALFADMFYRFFLVHELGHRISGRVIAGLPDAERKRASSNMAANASEKELVPNRIAVAWFREHDPHYLDRLVADFRRIEAHLPSPVPAGADPKRYLTENYARLGSDPVAYGWYQLYMVITVYDETPKSFQQTLDSLPKLRYDEE